MSDLDEREENPEAAGWCPAELGFLVNYYSSGRKSAAQDAVLSTTILSLKFLRMSPVVGRVLLMDGSPEKHPELAKACSDLNVEYYHEGRSLELLEACDIGWRKLDAPYIGVMANDIIPSPITTIADLLDWIKRPGIGCAQPYFASTRSGGDEPQRLGFWNRGDITCEPTVFTLNLNLFKRETLELIGGFEDGFKADFAEPSLTVRIRKAGLHVVTVGGTKVFHYDRLSKLLGEAGINTETLQADNARWREAYPEYVQDSHEFAPLATYKDPFSLSWKTSLAWWLVFHLPFSSLRKLARIAVLWIEPWLTRYPVRQKLDSNEQAYLRTASQEICLPLERGRWSMQEMIYSSRMAVVKDCYADGWVGKHGALTFQYARGKTIEILVSVFSGNNRVERRVEVEVYRGSKQTILLEPGENKIVIQTSESLHRQVVRFRNSGVERIGSSDSRKASFLIREFVVS